MQAGDAQWLVHAAHAHPRRSAYETAVRWMPLSLRPQRCPRAPPLSANHRPCCCRCRQRRSPGRQPIAVSSAAC
eukprot:310092-Chlamydomonas_euryale.AAC.3